VVDNIRVPLVRLLAPFAFAKSQQLNQNGWLSSKTTTKSSFYVVQT
jgi:hypothetical protein